jgi:hypothetical protein
MSMYKQDQEEQIILIQFHFLTPIPKPWSNPKPYVYVQRRTTNTPSFFSFTFTKP